MKSFLILALLTVSSHASANERGNGGDAVVCRDAHGSIISSELLDYYEGRTLRKLTPRNSLDIDNNTFYRSVADRLEGFETFESHTFASEAVNLAESLEGFIETGSQFRDDIIFTHEPLTDIPDSGELILKEGCRVEQLAIRLERRFPEDPEYIFQIEILRSLSPLQVRGLVLHELLYKRFVERGMLLNHRVPDSTIARYLHQKLTSRPIAEFFFSDYISVVKNFYDLSSDIISGTLRKKNGTFDPFSMIEYEDRSLSLLSMDGVRMFFHSDGQVDRAETLSRGTILMKHALDFYTSGGPKIIGRLSLDDSKNVHGIDLEYHKKTHIEASFGTWVMRVDLVPMTPIAGFDFGFSSPKVRASLSLRSDRKKPVSASKKFFVGLDEDFRPVIREL